MKQDLRSEIWVAGEAMIDLLPGGESFIEVVGGGPANTAKAIANLGLKSSFIGGISSDYFGKQIEKELLECSVNLSLSHRSKLPTAEARVILDEFGSASYEFKLTDTATFEFGSWLPLGSPRVLHVGSLATVVEPGASALYLWAKSLSVPIVFDPNIRPSVMPDREKYRGYFEQWVEICTVVKLSDSDLEWLGYSIVELFELGASLVVLTKGKEGLSGYRNNEEISVPAVSVTVIDTIGAGDTVGAIVVEALMSNFELRGQELRKMLERAAKAAAITCSRAGAKPPNRLELN